jgi:hypothetical protein
VSFTGTVMEGQTLSGTFLLAGSKLCAVLSGSNCDPNGWNFNSRLLAIVANGNGSNGAPENQVSAGASILLASSTFQGALYATNAVEIVPSSMQGPIIAKTISFDTALVTPFPVLLTVPVGLPGQ